jgi:hypothetical protein
VTGSETAARDWQGLADTKLHAYEDTDVRSNGWYCYRVRAKADDFAWSNEACVELVGTARPIPAPQGVTFERELPVPPDFIGVPRLFSWQWPAADAGLEAVIEASVPPRFSSEQPAYLVYARIASIEPARISVTTYDWRGPYCLRMRFALGKVSGDPSLPICVPQVTDVSPWDITNFTLTRSSLNDVRLLWEYLFLPTTVSIERSTAPLGAAHSWQSAASGVPARSNGNSGTWADPNPPEGYVCYRVKADRGGIGEFGEDSVWTAPSCIGRPPGPVVDYPGYPFPPDAGNSRAAQQGVFREELALSGLLLMLVAAANWLLFRGYFRGYRRG